MLPRPALALSIADWSGPCANFTPRRRIETVARWGGRGVQVDATLGGIRPRELDRSARRDLAALLRRLGLAFSGVDLFIPPGHLTDSRRVDRAVAALASACVLAADLSRFTASPHAAVVATRLPERLDPRVLDALRHAADRAGATIANLAWPVDPAGFTDGAGLAVGVDPAAVLAHGEDPAAEVARMTRPPAAARLTDLSAVGRVAPGSPGGRLDVLAYAAALHARAFQGLVVADLHGLEDPERAASLAITAWAA